MYYNTASLKGQRREEKWRRWKNSEKSWMGLMIRSQKLYEERMKVCEDVGRFKVLGRKVFDRQREHEKLDVASKVNG